VFTDKTDRRATKLVAQLALSVWMLAAPAGAAVVADFNGDGRPDPVTPTASRNASLFVTVSGLGTQVLHVSDRILAVVAVDIDHDGSLDLSTISERRGLSVWLNRGGRFVHSKRPHHPRGVTLERSGPRARPGESDSSVPSAPMGTDSTQSVQSADACVLAPPVSAGLVHARANAAEDVDRRRAQQSRAPPTLAPT
jgi:hypothetical protein